MKKYYLLLLFTFFLSISSFGQMRIGPYATIECDASVCATDVKLIAVYTYSNGVQGMSSSSVYSMEAGDVQYMSANIPPGTTLQSKRWHFSGNGFSFMVPFDDIDPNGSWNTTYEGCYYNNPRTVVYKSTSSSNYYHFFADGIVGGK